MRRRDSVQVALVLLIGGGLALPALAQVEGAGHAPAPQAVASEKKAPEIDRSGSKRVGEASTYAEGLSGRKMSDGARMDPHGKNAASKTLPLGTTAKVTNLETGQSVDVKIEDRGPFVRGRIVDLSPASAQEIGITKQAGVAKVEITPTVLPAPPRQ